VSLFKWNTSLLLRRGGHERTISMDRIEKFHLTLPTWLDELEKKIITGTFFFSLFVDDELKREDAVL
jgi:hypothetical protein